jgi:hypothetical protein
VGRVVPCGQIDTTELIVAFLNYAKVSKNGSFRNKTGWLGLTLSACGQGPVTNLCEHGHELAGYIPCGDFLD